MLLLATVLTCVSCDDKVVGTRDPQGGATWVTVTADAGMCEECIDLSHVAVLGEKAGPGFLVESHFVVRDDEGRFWIMQPGGPKVFDSAGHFLRQVGAAGQGPFEFIRPKASFVDGSGRVHVFDIGNSRETVVNPNFTLAYDRPLISGPIQAVVPLADDSSYVANMPVLTSELIGLPLHVVRGGRLASSFGAPMRGSVPTTVSKRLAVDSQGRIYAADTRAYRMEVWTESGERIVGLYRPGLWNPSDAEIAPLTTESTILPPLVAAIHVDSTARLWVVVWLPKDDWREGMKEVVYPNGRIGLQPLNGSESVFYTRIEVIDLSTGTITAIGTFDDLIGGFFSDGLVHGPTRTKAGIPQVVISHVRIEQQGLHSFPPQPIRR